MSSNEFLLEIGIEELPAIPFLKEAPNLAPKWQEILRKNGFNSEFELFFTPRRITLYSKNFNPKANDEELELWGPPVAVAMKDGTPTKAYESFLERNSLVQGEVQTAQKDGKECLYAKKTLIGKSIEEKLNEMLSEWLASLHFGKSMRWGSLIESFIRPIRWIVAMQGSTYFDVQAYGVKSGELSYGHRQESFEPFHVLNPQDYFAKLAAAGVMLSSSERKSKILDDIKAIEAKQGLEVELDEELLAEVTAITEYPTALLGTFDKAFLKVPSEVIITSMKENQRYFPVFVGGKLSNHFVVVSNAFIDSFDKVVAGNERVLKARLSDALFFYENDLKKGLSNEGLQNIVFVEGLGSVADKVQREVQIAEYLAKKLNIGGKEQTNLIESARLGKADLMTEVVYEFGELQGVMGCYYAKEMGLDSGVAEAIKEQYMPKGEDGELPQSLVGSLLSISVKLDSLLGLFSVGMIPSGSKDPYALRRAAIGIIKNLLHFSININIKEAIKELSANYKTFDTDKLESFIFDRLYQLFSDINPSVISAVLASGDRDVVSIAEKIEALNLFVKKPEFKEQFSTFKRVANISKDIEFGGELPVNTELFDNDYEALLWGAYTHHDYENASYHEILGALFSLKGALDAFFDNCMVNAEDEAVRTNRKNLIARVYKQFLSVADIKEIGV